MGPSTTCSQNRRAEREPWRFCAKRVRNRPSNAARSPMRAGSSASIRSRSRRASTGDAPPVPTATTTSPRSMIAGNMNVDKSGRSTTLTGMPAARARAATTASIASPAALTTAMYPENFACIGSDATISTEACEARAFSAASAAAVSARSAPAYQRTRAPAARRSRSLVCASSPEPTRATVPAATSRNTGRKRIRRDSGLMRSFFYMWLVIRL